MFKSLPLAVREVRATEATLERIYEAAYLGLKNDALALAAGMLPVEYRRLKELDQMAELAELKAKNADMADQFLRAKADAEEANVSKTRFLAAASHDILQPLNAARLYITSLIERQGVIWIYMASAPDGVPVSEPPMLSDVDAGALRIRESVSYLMAHTEV